MKTNVVTVTAVIIITGACAAYAATETITMNAIDANGVGKEIGTLTLSDTQAGLQITPQLDGLPPGDHGFHAHVKHVFSPQGTVAATAQITPTRAVYSTADLLSGHRRWTLKAHKQE